MTQPQNDHALSVVEGRDLAIGIQINAQVGPNRSMTLTTGIPLETNLSQLNDYIDKLMKAADRQNDKGMLEQTKAALEQAERDFQTSKTQRDNTEANFRTDWSNSGKRGEFRPNDAQRQQIRNFESTANNLRDVIIPKLKKQVAELEERTK